MSLVRAGYLRLTPAACRVIFVVFLLLNAWSQWRFLTHGCPIDLSGDEAQYWDWSRHLDWSYYSKGPLVALVIRAGTALMGDTMPGVRSPVILFTVGTSFCTYWLTRKLFGSDRLALGAFLIGGIVPMYSAGSVLMTIDPPLFFCFAVSNCLLVKAVFDDSKWAWPAAGVAAGVGVLAKYGMLLWPPIVLVWLATDPTTRRRLRSWGPWVMTAVTLLFLIPPIVWNAHHDWVSFHHVATQTTAEHTALAWVTNVPSFVGAQVGAVNPALAVVIGIGLLGAFGSTPNPAARFLATIGGLWFALCFLDAFVTKVQVNWPAPAYFTLLILAAYTIGARWARCRPWFVAAVVFGLLAGTLLRDPTALYPAARWADRHFPLKPRDGQPRTRATSFDLEYKMRGIADPFAATVDRYRHDLYRPFVLCEDYMDASQLAFYLPDRPATYFAGSYWIDPAVRRRWTQFDLWPDRQLDSPALLGRDAVYVGTMAYAPLRQSFATVTRMPDVVVTVDGINIRSWTVWECRGFKGMHRPAGEGPR